MAPKRIAVINSHVEIPLTKGEMAIVDAADYESVRQWSWYFRPDGDGGYAARGIRIGGRCKTILLHREILGALPGEKVDHVDGDGLNCRRSNLRIATTAQNAINRGPTRKSETRLKGVCRRKDCTFRPYMAQIQVNRKTIYLGCFATAEDAARARDAAAIEHFGEFAWLNFPKEEPRG